jgi:perosamine synthetase
MDAFLSTWISSSGEYIKKFEDQFSTYSDCNYGVAVSNGTVALHLALVTLGIGSGDEVIVPDLTFAATINTVLHANATPVIVDIEKNSWCIDPKEIEKAITPRTKAIVPVHLYGQPCDMDAIMKIAKKHGLFVVEDCAEAHGARYKGKKAGSFGDIGCFSFYGNKVITTGEGGMCVTNNPGLDEKMRVLRDHGMSKTKKYWHEYIGYNYRMTNLQAAIGLAQLERIDEIHKDRERIESSYLKELSALKGLEFQKSDLRHRNKITWLVCALIKKNRDKYLLKLQQNGIEVRPFFYSLGDMELYSKYVFSNKVSKEISAMGINFPTNNTVNKRVLKKISQILTAE